MTRPDPYEMRMHFKNIYGSDHSGNPLQVGSTRTGWAVWAIVAGLVVVGVVGLLCAGWM